MQILIHKSKTKVYFEKKEKINNIFGGYKKFLKTKKHINNVFLYHNFIIHYCYYKRNDSKISNTFEASFCTAISEHKWFSKKGLGH